MDLRALYDSLIGAGCNRFYIDGLGGPQSDDVDCLGLNQGIWEVYYTERGQSSEPFFTTPNMQEAIVYYYKHVMAIEHWHLVTFTRSFQITEDRKLKLAEAGIPIIENNIPHYQKTGDLVYRLFVNQHYIFKAKEIFDVLPYMDEGLKSPPGSR